MRWPWSAPVPVKLSEREVVAFVEALLTRVAEFVDEHDVLVPELTVRVGVAEVTLSMKRVDRAKAPPA